MTLDPAERAAIEAFMSNEPDPLPDLLGNLRRPDWHRDSACIEHPGTDWFKASHVDQAKAVCAACLVRVPCLEDALARGERYGVWGGTSEEDRRAMRKAE